MDWRRSPEQELLAEQARRLLARQWGPQRARQAAATNSHDRELWAHMAALGWTAMAVPEKYCGSGASLLDLAVLYEELGRALVPTTFYSTTLAALALRAGASEEEQRRVLPPVAEGRCLLTVALAEPGVINDPGRIATRVRREGHEVVLEGRKLFVPNAETADEILVVARVAEGLSAFLVPARTAGLATRRLATIGGDQQSALELEGVRVPAGRELAEGYPAVDRALREATALQSVEMVGGAEAVLEMTTAYVKERRQFGRPLGSFQAVQHQCADMATAVDGARHLAYQAAWLVSEGRLEVGPISMAKAWCSETYKRATLTAHQLFGGVGFTLDHPLHLYSQRAKAAELTLGTPEVHLERVAQALGL